MKKEAFTLAEVLTTLMVIGVVAALTIPTLTQNIGNAILEHQQKIFKAKLEEGFHRMAVEDKLGKKYTTKSFVNEFKNYFKVAITCDPNNLVNCFGEKITNGEDEFEVANLKKAKDFNSNYPNADVYGVRFPDGTGMLMTYEPNCKGFAASDIPKEAEIGTYAKCVKYIYDVNGEKAENTFGSDMLGTLIPTKSSGSFGLSFTIIGNRAFRPGETYEGQTYTCADATQATGNEHGSYTCDYWLGAKRFCESIGGSLPDAGQLTEIFNQIYLNADCRYTDTYNDQPNYEECNETKVQTANPELWAAITNGSNYTYLWSSVPASDHNALNRFFYTFNSSYFSGYRNNNDQFAICVR